MSNQETRPPFPSGSTFGVYGERIDIELSSPEALAERLSKASEAPLRLIDSTELSTELPPPIDRVIFEAHAPQSDDGVPLLSASVDLSIDCIRDFQPANDNLSWSTTYLHIIISYLRSSGFTVDYIQHDLNTIHTRLDHNYAASIKLTSDLHSFTVKLSLETIDDLENILGVMSEIPPDKSSEPVIVTQYFATALGASIDAALDTFDTPDTTRHLLELIPPARTRAEKKLATMAAIASLEAPKFPEAEQIQPLRGLDRLSGLFAVKQHLREIAEDYGESEAAYMYEISPTHFLLYGPPGIGKSTIVEALAEEINAELVTVPTSSIHGEFVGKSALNLKAIFDTAFEKNKPQVLFFDEFETLGKIRNSSSNHLEARKLLQQLILQTSREHPEIIIAAAMNADKDDIEPALIRPGRLETIPVALPTTKERLDILSNMLSSSVARLDIFDRELATLDGSAVIGDDNFTLYDKSINCIELAQKMDDYSIADIVEALKIARRMAYRRYRTTGNLDAVSHQDILAAIETMRLR